MNRRQYHLLLHPAFLLSIFLLLLNDISLKYQFANLLTGKLSDFAGLFSFAVFLLAFFPKHRNSILVVCGLFFIWWKSSLSQPFIISWNNIMPFGINRVVDYSDLMALIVLPFAGLMVKVKHEPVVHFRPVWIRLICIMSLFSFCFTSYVSRNAMHYTLPENEVQFDETFYSRKTKNEILEKLSSHHINYFRDSVTYYRVPEVEFYLKTNVGSDSAIQWIHVPNSKDSVLYIRKKESPFYIIPVYHLDGDELHNVKFTFSTVKKDTEIFVKTFQSASYTASQTKKLRKKFKRHFDLLFK